MAIGTIRRSTPLPRATAAPAPVSRVSPADRPKTVPHSVPVKKTVIKKPPAVETAAAANATTNKLDTTLKNLAGEIAALNANQAGLLGATNAAGITSGAGTAASPIEPATGSNPVATTTSGSTSSGILSSLTSGGYTTYLIAGAVAVGGFLWWRHRKGSS